MCIQRFDVAVAAINEDGTFRRRDEGFSGAAVHASTGVYELQLAQRMRVDEFAATAGALLGPGGVPVDGLSLSASIAVDGISLTVFVSDDAGPVDSAFLITVQRLVETGAAWSPSELVADGIASETHLFDPQDAIVDGSGQLLSWESRSAGAPPISVNDIVGNIVLGNDGSSLYLESDGASYLEINALTSLATGVDEPVLIAAGVDWLDLTLPTTAPYLAGFSSSTSTTPRHDVGVNATTWDGWRYFREDDAGASFDQSADSPSIVINQKYSIISLFDGTGWEQYSNLVGFPRNVFDNPGLGQITFDQFTVFARRGNSVTANGTIARLYFLLVAKLSALPRPERLLLHNYLSRGIAPPWSLLQPCTVAAPPGRHLRMLGQSNQMGARVDPKPQNPIVRARFFEATNLIKEWSPLETLSGDLHGPEFGFADQAAAAGQACLAVSKHAVGGTSLADQGGAPLSWLPTAVGVQLYPRTVKHLRTSIAELGAIEGVLEFADLTLSWFQGEEDSGDAGDAAAYGTNLLALSAALRTEFTLPNMLWTAPVMHKDLAPAFSDTVRAGEETWARNAPDINQLIPVDDLALEADNIHYSGANLDIIGQRTYDAETYARIADWYGALMYDAVGGDWLALRGGNRSMTEATNPPTVGAINTIAAPQFNGVDEQLDLNAFAAEYSDPAGAGVDLSLVAVVQFVALSAHVAVLSFTGPAGGNYQILEIKNGTGNLWQFVYRGDSGTVQTKSSTFTFDLDPHVLALNLRPDGTLIMRVDGVDESPATGVTQEAITLSAFGAGYRANKAANFANVRIGYQAWGRSFADVNDLIALETKIGKLYNV